MNKFKWSLGKNGWGNPLQIKRLIKYAMLVTDDCNLNCQYCFQKSKVEHCMSNDIFKKCIDKVFEIEIPRYDKSKTRFSFQFFGGEPFLYPELVDFGTNYIKTHYWQEHKEWINITIVTNGTLYDNPKVQEVTIKYPELKHIISFDGTRESQNSLRAEYDRIVTNIKWLQQYVQPSINLTISPDNVHLLYEGFKFIVNEFGIKDIFIPIVMDDIRWSENRYSEMLYSQACKVVDLICLPENRFDTWCNLFEIGRFFPNKPNNPVCYAINNGLSCSPTGKLYSCFTHRNPSIKGDYSIGDVDNWINNEQYNKIKHCTLNNIKGLEECSNCDIGSGCKHCCGAFAENYGTMLIGDMSFCKAHHALFFATKYLYEERNKIWIELQN